MNEYEYEYYLYKTYSTNPKMYILLDILCHKYEQEYYSLNIFTNLFEYLNIFKYLKIIKPKVTAPYQSEECASDI